jgi:hypothetical protein
MKKELLFNLCLLLGAFALCTVVTSCGSGSTEDTSLTTTTITTDEEDAGPELWQYDHSATKVIWTGYKLESKAGVEGSFDSIVVEGFSPGPDASKCITGVKFELYTASTETADTSRNRKIITRFFGEMINGAKITGEIKSIDAAGGVGVISVKMNDVEKDLDVSYEMDKDNVIKMIGTIDIPSWNGQAALDSLNKVCYEKHEGITWQDAEVKILAKLKK